MKKLMMLMLAALFSAGAAFAEDVDFDALDQDGDGQLSRTEVAQDSTLAANFSRMDTNGDGYLSEDEVNTGSMDEQDTGQDDYQQ